MRWVLETDEPPSWGVHRGKGEGRRSRVSHPSEALPRFKIREPRTERRAISLSPTAAVLKRRTSRRMRWKPVGSTWIRNRGMNSCASFPRKFKARERPVTIRSWLNLAVPLNLATQ